MYDDGNFLSVHPTICSITSLAHAPTGYWQEALAGLGRFDAVFLDDFPLPLDDEEGSSKERRQAQRDEQRILAAVGSRWHAFLDLAVR